MVAIHQFIPSYAPRDAVGTHTRHMREVFHGMGIASDLYVVEARGVKRGEVRYFRDFKGAANGEPTWLLYQLSTGSPMAGWLAARPEPKLVDYHNITPPEFFEEWEPGIAPELAEGRRQIPVLAPTTTLALADSSYNAGDLLRAGYRNVEVLPILIDIEEQEQVIDLACRDRLAAAKKHGGADWLFVGRICPNKCQHDLIKAFAAYRRLFDPEARLHIVGTSSSHSYFTAVTEFVKALGLQGAVDFAGSVSDGERSAHYATADVFVCLSEHEGFCVPLLEAFGHDLPVVAFDSSAVPETLGDGGVLLGEKDPAIVAATVHRVVTDEPLRRQLTAAGRERLQHFALARSEARLRELVGELTKDVR